MGRYAPGAARLQAKRGPKVATKRRWWWRWRRIACTARQVQPAAAPLDLEGSCHGADSRRLLKSSQDIPCTLPASSPVPEYHSRCSNVTSWIEAGRVPAAAGPNRRQAPSRRRKLQRLQGTGTPPPAAYCRRPGSQKPQLGCGQVHARPGRLTVKGACAWLLPPAAAAAAAALSSTSPAKQPLTAASFWAWHSLHQAQVERWSRSSGQAALPGPSAAASAAHSTP